jgi:hypothetical protein
MADTYMEKCLTFLAIKEMQIKALLIFSHPSQNGCHQENGQTTTNAGEDGRRGAVRRKVRM